jgi:hypothetical protein
MKQGAFRILSGGMLYFVINILAGGNTGSSLVTGQRR